MCIRDRAQRAGNGRCAHHQQVRIRGLFGQHSALPYPKAVLLVDHSKTCLLYTSLPALVPGVGNGLLQQLPGVPLSAAGRYGVYPKDHLPGTILPVEGGVGVHLIGQVRPGGAKAVHKGQDVYKRQG